MTKVIQRRQSTQRPPSTEPVISRDGVVVSFDGGLYRGSARRPVSVGIDPARAALAVSAYCPDDDSYFIWLIKTKEHWVRGLLDIQMYLGNILHSLRSRHDPVLHVAMENYSYESQYQLASMGEVGGLIKVLLIRYFGSQNKVAYPTLVAANQLKKFATGSGQSKKNLIMLSVYKKWGIELREDNAADSYTLSRVAAALATGKTAHAYEREVIEKLRVHTEWQPPEPGQEATPPSSSRPRARKRESSE